MSDAIPPLPNRAKLQKHPVAFTGTLHPFGAPVDVPPVEIPREASDATLDIGGRAVKLTNLQKPFWPELGITKGDLLRYYAAIAPALLPHLIDRAMVMKRYPHGAGGDFFFMKNAPSPRPDWIEICSIWHNPANTVDFPVIQDLASLLWVINLGCIDLNPWYARCDDVDQPDFLHFDLDPGDDVPFGNVCRTALIVRDALAERGMPSYAKTSGSSGIHVYVPLARGLHQKEVWTFAKALAIELEAANPDIITARYRIAERPPGRVLVDYNQNAWGRTLASVYSVRPTTGATVSTPVKWDEVAAGVNIATFTMSVTLARVAAMGDLWAPVLAGVDTVPLRHD